MKSGQREIEDVQKNKEGYIAVRNVYGQVSLFDPQENIVFEKLDGFKGLQLTEKYLATCNTDNLLTLRSIKTKEVIFKNVNASFGFKISEDETLLST
ncbi:MAG: hypothetical protein GTN76_05205, partial [Candidatus Aenigmarchaeota archaeon]|nr:hypothetical protein [Candidatus Aenigmarchaeota archaeon]